MGLCRLWHLCALIIVAPVLAAGPVGAQSTPPDPAPVGEWETIDENSHRVKSLVLLSWQGHELVGRIQKILDTAAPPHAVCQRCAGVRRDQPIEGMTFLWGLTRGGEVGVYEGGTVLDPSNGKEYRCRVRLRPDGNLEIRGYVGIPMFGRSQVWRRPSRPPSPRGS